ncbi:hypothetical protein ACLOJK_007198 [Asimina triloba]
MVFKGRFFSSSKKSDSSDGSNSSPKTPTLGSPSPRSEKKKVKSDPPQICRQTVVKDGAKNQPQPQPQPQPPPQQNYLTQKKKDSVKGKEAPQPAAAASPSGFGSSSSASKLRKGPLEMKDASPLVAASLGLNRIKTRSGPLPQESFLGFRAAGADKGSALGASNLSRLGGAMADECSTSSAVGRGGGRKVAQGVGRKALREDGSWADAGSSCDSMYIGSGGASRDQSPNVQGGSKVRNNPPSAEMGMAALVSIWHFAVTFQWCALNVWHFAVTFQ